MYQTDLNGFLLINKESGKTSFQVIAALRKILQIKKIGHSGILDSHASGLLLLAVGRATRLLKYFFGLPKSYIGEIFLGEQRATDDAVGKVVQTSSGPFDINLLESTLKTFEGKILQVPPDYSSIHINGKRAYKIALKDEKPTLKAREVEIFEIKMISYQEPIFKIQVSCSSGTYIRSIARDLGTKTGYYGYLYSLVRTSIGPFLLDNAVTLDDLRDNGPSFMTSFDACYFFNELEVTEDSVKKIKNGMKFQKKWLLMKDSYDFIENQLYKVHFNKQLLAIVKFNNGNFYYDLVY